jgi:hypothetical protein
MRRDADFAVAPACGGDLDLVADLRGLLELDVRLAFGFALPMLSGFFATVQLVVKREASAGARGSQNSRNRMQIVRDSYVSGPLTNFIVGAIARDRLPATSWTFLNVASHDMKLAFYYTTVVTRNFIGSPIRILIAVSYSRIGLTFDAVGENMLGFLNTLRPAFDHGHAAIQNSLLLRHNRQPKLNCPLQTESGLHEI